MCSNGVNALATNLGWWVWSNQILSPKTMNVITTVGTKRKYTSCVLWHAYQLATSQVRSQPKKHKKIATLNPIRILQGYVENIFLVNLLFFVCLWIVVQMCFFNSLHLRQNFGILKTSVKIQFNYLFCFS